MEEGNYRTWEKWFSVLLSDSSEGRYVKTKGKRERMKETFWCDDKFRLSGG